MQLKKYIRRNMYRWHRISGMLIAVPILLWTISGFLHPVMSSFKPSVKNQVLPADSIDPAKIKKPLKDALAENKISRLHNYRIIYMNGNYFYQIREEGIDSLTYLNCEKGKMLPDGDQKYAAFLANSFLSEKNQKPGGIKTQSPDVSSFNVT